MGASVTRGREKWVNAAIVFGAWLVGALVFFREQWASGFNHLMGNDGDTRLIAYFCEHWFRVFHGQDSWTSPGFFYPVKGLLGWSDGFLLYEVFYAPLRLLGFDPFVALQLTVVLLSLVGFMSFVYLVRMLFHAPRLVAIAFGLVFTFSNALWLHAGSFQDDGIYIVPLVLVIAVAAWRAAVSGRSGRAVLLGASAGLLSALLFFTTYYTSYFTLLAAGLVVGVAVVLGRRPLLQWVRDALRTTWRPLVAGCVMFAAAIVPFLTVYLPANSRAGGESYAQVSLYEVKLAGLANIGTGNLVWRSTLPHLLNSTAGYEQTYAVTPLLALCAGAGALGCVWLVLKRRAFRPRVAWAAVVLAGAALIEALLPVRVRGHSLWGFAYHLPGAGAMRAVDRIQIVAGMLAILAATAAFCEIATHIRDPRRVGLSVAGVALLGLLVAEQVNTTDVSHINDRAQSALLRSVTPPPPACQAFYVVDTTDPNMAFFEFQVDAMLISQRIGVPTINGYTAYNPKGWQLEEPGSSAYMAGVVSWTQAADFTGGLCQLDLATMHWAGPVSGPALATFNPASAGSSK